MNVTSTTARVFTATHIERLQRMNRLVRRLKAMGYRVTATSMQPFSDAMPVIGIALGMQGTQPLYATGNGSLRDAHSGVERTVVDGVWVSWSMDDTCTSVACDGRRVAA